MRARSFGLTCLFSTIPAENHFAVRELAPKSTFRARILQSSLWYSIGDVSAWRGKAHPGLCAGVVPVYIRQELARFMLERPGPVIPILSSLSTML